MKNQVLLLLDGNALIHRAFHAIPPTLKTKQGEPTNAVFGYLSSLISAIEHLKPTHIAATFDPPGKTFRHQAYQAYKATRQHAPTELYDQLDRARQLTEALHIPIYEAPGFEADDAIGTIVHELKKQPIDIVIASGDKDTLQLLSPQVKVWTLKQGMKDSQLYDEAMLKQERNLTPAGFRFAKALRGDPSDNIPGVAGVGEKTANLVASLAETPAGLEHLLSQKSESELKSLGLSPAMQTKLKDDAETIRQSYDLVTIRHDAPIHFKLDEAKTELELDQPATELLQALEFNALLKRLLVLTGQTLFGQTEQKVKRSYTLVNKTNWPVFLTELQKQSAFAVDTETDSISALHQRLIGCSFSWQAGQAYYLPFGHDKGDNLGQAELKVLAQVLADREKLKIGHNLKFDLHTFANTDVQVEPPYFDTMVAAHLLHPDKAGQSLDECAFVELGEEMVPIEAVIGKAGKDQRQMNNLLPEAVANYAAEDADMTWRLYDQYHKALKTEKLLPLMTELEMPLMSVLFAMERQGVLLNTTVLKKQAILLEKSVDEIQKQVIQLAGVEFNLNSAGQLAAILFERLKLSSTGIRRKTDRPSTAASELEKLRGRHPIIPLILEYREKTKLISTYVAALPAAVDQADHRLHTTYSQTTASTGRLASLKPNLQNIPIRTPEGRLIRTAFVAPGGSYLLSADYSQIELRIVAHFSKDPHLSEVFRSGRDLHTATAAEIFHVTESEVTSQQRRIAKAINFSLMFGVSAFGLAEYIGTSREEAASFIERYFTVYAGVKKYMDQLITETKQCGYGKTLFGRRLSLPDLASQNAQVRGAAERLALNMPIQGTEAEILKRAMITIHQHVSAKLILTVHDELVFEVVKSQVKQVGARIRQLMEETTTLDVPIVAELKVGDNWGDMNELQLE